jgi:hypothetical protein
MADGAFSSYHGGVFTGSIAHDINHLVVLVGWDDNQGSDGIWYLRNSWGTMWGEQGYMRIERGRNAVGWNATWVDYRDPIEICLDGDLPGVVAPGEPLPVTVRLETRTDSYVSGTAMLHCRTSAGAYNVLPLDPLGRGLYHAELPAAACGDTLEYFFSVAGLRFGSVYTPTDPLENRYVTRVGDTQTVFHDDFESDLGWSVTNGGGLTGGAWERGVPVGGGDRSDPPTDYDGSGSCYLTGNADGDSDVDGGWTMLVSPVVDLSDAEDAAVEFAYWYRNDHGDNPNGDFLRVYLSDDGGAHWVTADEIGPRAPLPIGWKRRTVIIGDYVEPTDMVRVAIEVADDPGGSLVEGAVDDFRISSLSCGAFSSFDEQEVVRAGRHAALANAPNPFGPSTAIGFYLPQGTDVTLTVYAPSGRVVRTLVDSERRSAGEHSVTWDGLDDGGAPAASGVYFYRMIAAGKVLARRMVLLR